MTMEGDRDGCHQGHGFPVTPTDRLCDCPSAWEIPRRAFACLGMTGIKREDPSELQHVARLLLPLMHRAGEFAELFFGRAGKEIVPLVRVVFQVKQLVLVLVPQ